LNYYMLQPATIRQQQPTRSKGPWTGGILDSGPWRGGVLDNGPWTGGVHDKGPWTGGVLDNGPWTSRVLDKGPWTGGILDNGPWAGGVLDKGPWTGGVLDNGPWTGGVLDNGPYIDLFPTSNEVWVTDVIFSNGVVPWEIPIYFFSLTTISQILIKIAVLGYKHFMLENRNIGVNMGTEALVAG
jgi:hypothetical protein